MAEEQPGIEAAGPSGAIAVDRATAQLAGILEPGEEIRYATSASIGTIDTFLGPFTIAVTDRRIVVARRSWLGRVRRLTASHPLPTTIQTAVRIHGSAVRIGDSRRWLYVRPQVAADLERIAGGGSHPAAASVDEDSPEARQHAATRARLRSGVRVLRYVRIGLAALLFLIAILRFLGGANGGATTVTFAQIPTIPTVPTTAFPTTPSTATVPQNTGTTSLAFGDGGVWATDGNDDVTLRLDPATGGVVAHIPSTDGDPVSVAVGDGDVWVANFNDSTVSRIDPRTNRASAAAIAARNGPVALAVGDGGVWVVDENDNGVARIDPATGSLAGSETAVGSYPDAIAVSPGAVWVANYVAGTVSRIDPASGSVVGGPITVGLSPIAIATGDGAAWVANAADDTVSQIDLTSGRVVGAPINVGAAPEAVAVTAGAVFTANNGDSTISVIDPQTRRVRTVDVATDPDSLAVGDGSLWIGNDINVKIQRLSLARLAG